MYSSYRDNPAGLHSNTDLQDYYDTVPPAHRLSGQGYNSVPNDSSTHIPMMQRGYSGSGSQPGAGASGGGYSGGGGYSEGGSGYAAGAGYAGAGAAGAAGGYAAGAASSGGGGGSNDPFFVNSSNDTSAYARNENWREAGTRSVGGGGGKKKWFIIGGVVTVLVIAGIIVGVLVSKNSNKSSSSSSSGTKSNSGGTKQTDPNDPSSFTKDSNLKQSFYGIAYTPEGSQLPDCGNSLGGVISDIQLLSQLTKRIRLYGADCNQTALVLEAIKQTKVEMEVFLGNYVVADDNGAAYTRQKDLLVDAIKTYGTDHISGITVGNEFMLNYLTDKGATDPDGPDGEAGADLLLSFVTDMRTTLSGMSLPKTIPVGNSDAGSFFSSKVLAAVDYGMSNVHPWFANTTINDAAGWTYDFFQEQNVQPAAAINANLKMYIAETGWPSGSKDEGSRSNGPAVASVDDLQIYLDTFVCASNTNGTAYFYFEAFDEPWKDVQFGGVEGYWGLFDKDRNLKNVKIPDCAANQA